MTITDLDERADAPSSGAGSPKPVPAARQPAPAWRDRGSVALQVRLARARRGVRRARRRARPVVDRVGRILEPVTSLGWTLVVVGVATWIIGARFDWDELLILAATSLVIVGISLLWTLGRVEFDVEVSVTPARILVGGDAVGGVRVRGGRGRQSLGGRVEVPVGRGIAAFDVGGLGSEGVFEDSFVVPTQRRAVIPIGPARTVKGDPLGIARREIETGSATTLYVHPVTSVLPPFSSGWLRDLEGRTTNDLSTSDVAFHTLREYVPGDDRRHIHWRTTARFSGLGDDKMMIRQFVDTRRSHLNMVLSTAPADWADEAEFELGVSVVGSLGRTALLDGQEVSCIAGDHEIPSPGAPSLLDGLAGVEQLATRGTLAQVAQRARLAIPDASIAAVVTGSAVDPAYLRAVGAVFGHDVTVFGIRCRPGLAPERRQVGHVTTLDVGSLDDLARVFAVVGG